jgi:hypothetical protein
MSLPNGRNHRLLPPDRTRLSGEDCRLDIARDALFSVHAAKTLREARRIAGEALCDLDNEEGA